MELMPYIVLGLIPAIFGAISPLNPSYYWRVCALACFILFMGFRFEVGPDWRAYLNLHQIAFSSTWAGIFAESEPLSMALFRLSELLNTGMTLTNLVGAAILVGGAMSFAGKMPFFWVAYSVCVPYLILVFGMSGIRQAMAVGVTLFVLSRWTEWGVVPKLLGVFLGAMFHSSAIIMVIPVFLGLKASLRLRLAMAIPLFGAVGYILSKATMSEKVVSVYSTRHMGDEQIASTGVFFHISLVALPALYALLNRRVVLKYVRYKDLFYVGCFGSILLVPIGLVSSTGASRLSLYLYFVPMMVYPAIICAYFRSSARLMQILFCISQAVLLILWLLTANTAAPYIPYRFLGQ